MRRWLRGTLVLLIVAACSKENNVDQSTNIGAGQKGKADEGVACKVNEECSSATCLAGFCRVTCDAASACSRPGSVCLYQGVGAPGGCSLAPEGACKSDADCGPFACVGGQCRSRCTAECKQGEYCIDGACYGKTEAGKIGEAIQCLEEKRPPVFCDGSQLVSCNAPGSPGRTLGPSCDTPTLCQQAADAKQSACPAASCKEGEKRCNPQSFAVEVCNAARTGFVAEQGAPACLSLPLCQAFLADPKADCSKAACAAGQTRCHDGNPEACNKGLTSFEQADDCGGSKQCDAQLGKCVSIAIDKREVTRGDYFAFLQKAAPAAPAACKQNPTLVPGSDDPAATWPEPAAAEKDLPVTGVDWCDAFAFCQAAGKRLCGKVEGAGAMVPLASVADPSVNEWLNACSSGGEFEFAYGPSHDLSKTCWDAARSGGKAQPVTAASDCASPRPAYKASENMVGNVAEWVNACDATEQAGAWGDNCRALGGDFTTEFNQTGCSTGASTPVPRGSKSDKVGFRCCGP